MAEIWDSLQGDAGDGLRQELLFPWIEFVTGKPRGLRVLDIGCGTGALSRRLSRKGASVVGIDASIQMIEVAERRHNDRAVRFAPISVYTLKPGDFGAFDLAVGIFSLQDIEDVATALTKVKAVLKVGGKVVLVVEDYEYMRDPELHRFTKRIPIEDDKGDINGISFVERQVIIWSDNARTISWARPIGYYMRQLSLAKFQVLKIEALKSPHWATRCIGIVALAT